MVMVRPRWRGLNITANGLCLFAVAPRLNKKPLNQSAVTFDRLSFFEVPCSVYLTVAADRRRSSPSCRASYRWIGTGRLEHDPLSYFPPDQPSHSHDL